jgi:hypothetical protein
VTPYSAAKQARFQNIQRYLVLKNKFKTYLDRSLYSYRLEERLVTTYQTVDLPTPGIKIKMSALDCEKPRNAFSAPL